MLSNDITRSCLVRLMWNDKKDNRIARTMICGTVVIILKKFNFIFTDIWVMTVLACRFMFELFANYILSILIEPIWIGSHMLNNSCELNVPFDSNNFPFRCTLIQISAFVLRFRTFCFVCFRCWFTHFILPWMCYLTEKMRTGISSWKLP